MPGFDISEFSAQINKDRYVNSSKFIVRVVKKAPEFDVERRLTFRIIDTDLPGREVFTLDYKQYGPAYRMGYDMGPGNINFYVLLSEDFAEREYFDSWIDDIIGKFRVDDQQKNSFDIGYYDDYIGNAVITVYSEVQEAVYSVELVEAYPISIEPARLTYIAGEEMLVMGVTMAYRYYKQIEV